jgi:hypothetical protein
MFWLQEFGIEKGQRMKITVFWDVTPYSLVEKIHVPEKPTDSIF